MKAIIFDSSTLISFAMNGMWEELKKLKSIFKGKFIITKEVKHEIIDKPLTIKRFEFEALKIQKLLDKKILEMPQSINISEKQITKKTDSLIKIANETFYTSERSIHLIDSGETSCIALGKILDDKKIENVLAVDERTTRLLSEKPENLRKIFEKKLHTKIKIKKDNLKHFENLKFIRSSELVYVLYKKNLAEIKNKHILDAMLYAVKFKGCSISRDEIREIKKF